MIRAAQENMHAAAINQFGGTDTIEVQTLAVPKVGDDEVLIRVESAGVGVWDPFERQGGFVKLFEIEPKFPYILGSEGAGTVAAVGKNVKEFKEGDRVYALNVVNPKGGFYAEYVAIPADHVSRIPENLTTE